MIRAIVIHILLPPTAAVAFLFALAWLLWAVAGSGLGPQV